MKFGKVFAAQMVPEWRESYMNYNYLKSLLKEIQIFKQKNNPNPLILKRNLTLYRTFSGLTKKKSDNPKNFSISDVESQDIFVHRDHQSESFTATTFLAAAEEGAEMEYSYFRMLDKEFNKVERYYRLKMAEMMAESAILNDQMNGLVDFRRKVEKPTLWSEETTRSPMASTPTRIHAMEMDGEEYNELIDNEDEDKTSEEVDRNAEKLEKSNNQKRNRPPPLQLLKLNDNFEVQTSILKKFLICSNNPEIIFNKKNLMKVEQQLKKAFVVFYQKLRILKSYSLLNTMAFSKITKKYDKITSRNSAKSYMNMVDDSCLGSSNQIIQLMERVETTFITHFCNSNRGKGMNILRPKLTIERHSVTFCSGFLAGCSIALLLAVIILIQVRDLMDEEESSHYMEAMFPLYSLFGFLTLHMLMYASNLYFWARYRVNYSFIFGFKHGTELCISDVSLLGFGLSVLALGCLLLNLDIEMDPEAKDFRSFTEFLPLGLVVLLIIIMFCPFNIIYRSSRFFFVSTFFRCICSPICKVKLSDLFLAEQLTSQVQAIRSLKFYICYYRQGDDEIEENTCNTNTLLNTFYLVVAVAPYLCRLLQCLRRLWEEKDGMQGCNGLKYLFIVIAICFRTAYSLNEEMSCKIFAFGFSVVAAIYSTYWDLVVDWGLLQGLSKKHWLRDRLLVPHKSVYFLAMGLNVLLRFAWIQTVMDFEVPFVSGGRFVTAVASLEIIRRGIWNFFSLENEHLNNVAKYRAFKSVPFPFEFNSEDGQKSG